MNARRRSFGSIRVGSAVNPRKPLHANTAKPSKPLNYVKDPPYGGSFIYKKKPGDDLLSHPKAVPSALKSLTSVFGMGTGVASSQ